SARPQATRNCQAPPPASGAARAEMAAASSTAPARLSASFPASRETKRNMKSPIPRDYSSAAATAARAVLKQQSQRPEAGMAAAADDEVIVDRDFQGLRRRRHVARHFDVGAARRRVAARVVVHQD